MPSTTAEAADSFVAMRPGVVSAPKCSSERGQANLRRPAGSAPKWAWNVQRSLPTREPRRLALRLEAAAKSHQSAVYRLWTGSAGGPVLDGLEEAEAGSSSWDAWANSATGCPAPRSRCRASLRPGAGTITADRCHTSNPATYLPDQGGLAIGLAVGGAIPPGHRAPAVG